MLLATRPPRRSLRAVPSAFAHAAVGASLVVLLPRPARRPSVAVVLACLAALPDLDVVGFALGIPYDDPLGHRGASHSLAFAALVGAASFPLWKRRLPSDAGMAAVLSALAVASHGLLDVFTDAGHGVGLFLPFDDGRYFAPWRPIRTSPLSPSAFFAGRGRAVLANEAVWIGLPCAAFLGVVALLRRR